MGTSVKVVTNHDLGGGPNRIGQDRIRLLLRAPAFALRELGFETVGQLESKTSPQITIRAINFTLVLTLEDVPQYL